jgi:hemolysin III
MSRIIVPPAKRCRVYFLSDVSVSVIRTGRGKNRPGTFSHRQRPNPAPDWFGFHEVFHALTITAFLVQLVAVVMVVLA